MKFKQITIIMTGILLVALILRIFMLWQVPLYGDELTIALDAKSLLQTGKDQLGDYFPLTFKMGAGRPAGYVYSIIPFVALFGPSEFGVRALSIISGLGLVLLMFYLGRKLINEKAGIISAFLTAISPWDINLSRGGFEAHFALFLTVAGVGVFLKSKTSPWLLLITALCFGVAIHTYPTYKVTLPLLLLLMFWYKGDWRQYLQKKVLPYSLSALLILAVFGVLAISQTFGANSEQRFLAINAFSQNQLEQDLIQKVNSDRTLSNLPENLKPLFYNKSNEYVFLLGENYLNNFSLDFLFVHGDRNPRHNMSTMGEFYLIEIILMILGLVYLIRNHIREFWFLIIWVLLAPIPTTLLLESHALRNSLMMPPLILLSAAGLYYLWDLFVNKKIYWPLILVGVVFLIQFAFFAERLYFLAPNELSRFWSYPAKLASETVLSEKSDYDFIILSDKIDNIEYAYPSYNHVSPNLVISQNQQRTKLGDLQFKKFGNVYIGQIPDSQINDFINNLNGSVLFIGSSSERQNVENYQILSGKDKQDALIVKKKT